MGEKIRQNGTMDHSEIAKLAAAAGEKNVLDDFDARQVPPLILAYIGDAIYELIIRTAVIRTHREPVSRLHRKSTSLVKAETQSQMIGFLEETGFLSEQEEAVYKRGRNAKAATHAKNAAIQEYRRATGFEAVCGYLYLKGDEKRLRELVRQGLSGIGEADAKNHTGEKAAGEQTGGHTGFSDGGIHTAEFGSSSGQTER